MLQGITSKDFRERLDALKVVQDLGASGALAAASEPQVRLLLGSWAGLEERLEAARGRGGGGGLAAARQLLTQRPRGCRWWRCWMR